MVEFKNCPKCGGRIPTHWSQHLKCGWNVPEAKPAPEKEVEEVERKGLVMDMEKAISDAFEIGERIKEKYPEQYHQLDLTKVALSLFIQKRRERVLARRA